MDKCNFYFIEKKIFEVPDFNISHPGSIAGFARRAKPMYRFKSLFNSCEGEFREEEAQAIVDGDSHAEIICFLYDKKI